MASRVVTPALLTTLYYENSLPNRHAGSQTRFPSESRNPEGEGAGQDRHAVAWKSPGVPRTLLFLPCGPLKAMAIPLLQVAYPTPTGFLWQIGWTHRDIAANI